MRCRWRDLQARISSPPFRHRRASRLPSAPSERWRCPLRWELAPADPEPIDEQLWFEGSCGGRDFLVDGSGHTFPGRMTAWCPIKDGYYNVSFGEMGAMSTAARYFIRGFLSGNEPDPPEDEDGEMTPDDRVAWLAATSRFRRTGYWHGRWSTCGECGCVLLQDSRADRCEAHLSD